MIDHELKRELQNIKTAIKDARGKFSWLTLWLAGYLFTSGYLASSGLVPIENASWPELIIYGVLLFAGWPYALGKAIGGGIQ